MKIKDILLQLESLAPPRLQEHYDNAGLITGQAESECTGILCALDATEEVVQEAIQKKTNLIIAHHPIIFGGLKKITGRNYVERTIILAIKNDIAIYAIHTNLDNVIDGVNGKIASLLGLKNCQPLGAKEGSLKKIYSFVPSDHLEAVRTAIFQSGAGQIGNYSECSYSAEGWGTFKAGEGANPYVGSVGERHREKEWKIEAVLPSWKEAAVIKALKEAHPYEEVAYDVVTLSNSHPGTGSGLVGEWEEAIPETAFLEKLKQVFRLNLVRHTALRGKPVKKIALCGGAGSFLIPNALAVEAEAFITADLKYHEFFDADGRLLLCDIGHYESEQFTIDLLAGILAQKFPTFAVLKTGVRTNPVFYY